MERQSQATAIASSMAFIQGLKVPTEIWGQIFEEMIQDFFNEDSSNKFIATEDYWLFRTNKGKGVATLRGLPAFEHVIFRNGKLYRHFFSLRIQMSRIVISSDAVDNNMFDNPKHMHSLSRLFRNSMREVEISFRSITHERRYERRVVDHMRQVANLLAHGLFSVKKINHLILRLDDNLSSIYWNRELSHFASELLLGGIKRFMVRSPLKWLAIMNYLGKHEEDDYSYLLSVYAWPDRLTQSYYIGITSGLPFDELDQFLGSTGEKRVIPQRSRDFLFFGAVWLANEGKRLP